MQSKGFRQNLIIAVLAAGLVIASLWTYIGIRSDTAVTPGKEATLNITPDYKITSRKDVRIWPAGTVFEQGMAAYFYAAEPEVNDATRIQISGLDQGNMNGTIKSQVIIQAVDDKSQVYWSYLLQDIPEQKFTLTKGISGKADQNSFVSQGILIDAAAVYDLTTQIGTEINFQAGILQLVVNSVVNMSGTANGMPVEKSVNQSLPLTLQQVSFSLPKSTDIATIVPLTQMDNSKPSNKTFTDIIRSNLLQFSVTIWFGALLFLVIILTYQPKSNTAIEQRRFREWITEGSVEVDNRLNINILTLEGLVDLAIDLDKRVIHDRGKGKYYVFSEDIAYICDSKSD